MGWKRFTRGSQFTKDLYDDLTYLKKNKTYGKIIARLNYEKGGFSSLIKKTVRKINKFEEGNYKEQFIKVHKRWGQSEYLIALKNTAPNWSYAKYLKGLIENLIKIEI